MNLADEPANWPVVSSAELVRGLLGHRTDRQGSGCPTTNWPNETW